MVNKSSLKNKQSLPLLPLPSPDQPESIFVSIHLNSNRPIQIKNFLKAIENTASHPSRIEVIVHIDQGDTAMLEALQEEQKKVSLKLRWIATDTIHSFADTWKTYNLLLPLADPQAYFYLNVSDEVLFEDKGWDEILATYRGYFPDHIFRLRGSKYRFRNYTDIWECGFAPDSIAFYTRDWLMIQKEWNPCNGPDSFQQCVSYYLFTSDPFSHTQYYRDISLHFMKFSGEGAYHNMADEEKKKRITLSTRLWFILMSHRYQQEAKRRAMLLKAHIYIRAQQERGEKETLKLVDDFPRKKLLIIKNESVAMTFSYRLSWGLTTMRNIGRMPIYHYWAGGGREALKLYPLLGLKWILDAYWPALSARFRYPR